VRTLAILAVLATSLLCGCSRPPTQLLVVVGSDLLARDLQCVHVAVARVGDSAAPTERWFYVHAAGEPRVSIPFSFGVTAPDQDATQRVEIAVSAVRGACGDALDPAAVSTTDRVRTGFLPQQAVRVPMYLSRSCVGLVCPEGSECRQGTCADPVREPGTLEPVDQGGEIPAMPDVNVAFVTRTQVDGALGGLASADAICAREASEADLPGTFVAFLGTGRTSPADRLGTASGWIRTDRRTVAVSREALTSEPLVHPIALDALGQRVGRSETVWAFDPVGGNDCRGWTSNAASDFGGAGSTWGVVPEWWLSEGPAGCNWRLGRFYCFQIDHDTGAPPDVSAVGGRRIFVSDQLAGTPDEVCAASRARAGLAGSFTALVATTGASALSRVALDERAWVRMDGRTMFLDRANVSSDLPRLPVLFDASGVAAAYQVSTGAFVPSDPDHGVTLPGDASGTCQDWAGAGAAVVGSAATAGADWFSGGTTTGGPPTRRFYCLED